jgi:hypothetical protein
MHRETNWKLVFVHIGMALVIAYSLAIVVYWASYGIVLCL